MKKLISRLFAATLSGATLVIISHQAIAQELIVNGNFADTNASGSLNGFYGHNGNSVAILNVVGWTNTLTINSYNGYNWLFAPGTADGIGFTLWGSNNGGLNTITDPPGGGNFIAADGAFSTAAIQQTVTGLTPGLDYTLSFYWAAGQQAGFSGNTTENWTVSLGNKSFTTATVNTPSHGFTDWMQQTFTYTATAESEVLSFLAAGTPNGTPPFSLLADVSMLAPAPAPEPTMLQYGTLLLLIPFVRTVLRFFRKRAQA